MKPLSHFPSEPGRGLTSRFSPCTLPQSQHIHLPPPAPDIHPEFWHTHRDEVRLANVPETLGREGSSIASSIPRLGHRCCTSWLPLHSCPLSIRPSEHVLQDDCPFQGHRTHCQKLPPDALHLCPRHPQLPPTGQGGWCRHSRCHSHLV